MSIPEENKNKKSLKEWLSEFYEDTGTLSNIIRNIAFAGIGLIWIFKNSDSSYSLLPPPLRLPLKLIIIGLISDVFQYLWRALSIYCVYKAKYIKHRRGSLTDAEIENVEMPDIISIMTWVFFFLKIIFICVAYYFIFKFLLVKI